MAVKTSVSAQSTVLLRRPLPPKVTSSQTDAYYKQNNTKNVNKKREKLRKKECLALPSKENRGAESTDFARQSCNLDSALVLVKPRGPDPLPARQPRRLKDNPYEFPVEARFLPSLPEFTLEQFVQKCDAPGKEANAARQFIGRSDDTWFVKRINDLCRQQELRRQVIDAESAELPKRSARKPQRQIIFELAATILTCEETDLDKRITEILEEVKVTTSNQPPTWFQRQPGPDLSKDVGSMADTVRELSELSSLDARGAPDIAHILNRHLDQRQEHTTFDSKRESWPQSEVLLSRSPTAFFQGKARCSSPFRNDENQHETMLTAAEFIILESIVKCYTTLDLKAHFIAHLPNIEPLCMKLTVVNLSFNNFRVVPSQLLTIKNLVNLNLRNNPIKELPSEIGQLRQLQTLVVSFCLVSCIPVSLFSLKYLQQLDLSYNRLSFLPKEIGNLRSLREFSVEGNELGALPSGILQLKLKHFRMMNNFTHSLFWKETTSNQPQRLFHMAAQKMVSERYADVSVPEEIRKQILSPGICDCCDGPVFGPGVRIIKTVEEIFGVKTIPVIFTVCTHTCRRAFKKNPNAVLNWMSNKNCSR